jgi:hypothetical protein
MPMRKNEIGMHTPTVRKELSKEPFDWPGFLAAAAGGALASVAITGFVFATGNNIYHLPIVAELYNEPQFAGDEFIQSLRHYSSGVWLLLRGSASFIEPSRLFLLLALLSRFLSYAGLLACADCIGVRSRKERAFFTALIAATFVIQGESLAGDGGLFLNCFTHSELGNGLFLMALALALRRRIVAAGALAGVLFFVNAFMGVWAAFVLVAVFLAQLMRKELALRQALLRALAGAAIASAFAAPVVLSILSNPEFGKPLSFDYASYLSEYYPDHFLFFETKLSERVYLSFVVLAGVAALTALGERARLFLIAYAATCGVYAIGIVAPLLTHSPLVLNLHLLRVSGMIHFLAAFAMAALATSWFFGPERKGKLLAALLAVLVSLPIADPSRYVSISAAAVLIVCSVALLRRLPRHAIYDKKLYSRAIGALLASWLLFAMTMQWRNWNAENETIQKWNDEWRQTAAWARAHTPPDSIFLVPIANWNDEETPWDEVLGGLTNTLFEFSSHRRIWVDFKRGAAAMWLPSAYAGWKRRVDEVSALASHGDRLAYARAKKVRYVIEVCFRDREKNVIFATGRLCVYPAPSKQGVRNKSKA